MRESNGLRPTTIPPISNTAPHDAPASSERRRAWVMRTIDIRAPPNHSRGTNHLLRAYDALCLIPAKIAMSAARCPDIV